MFLLNTLLNMAYKIYKALLNERIRKDIESKDILPETQAGFRSNRGTMDSIYAYFTTRNREKNCETRGKLYAFFVDLRTAFDRVNRVELWRAMEREGVILVKRMQYE